MSNVFAESGMAPPKALMAHHMCLADECEGRWRAGGLTTLAAHLAAVHDRAVTTPSYVRVDMRGRLLDDRDRPLVTPPPTDVDGWIRTQTVNRVSHG